MTTRALIVVTTLLAGGGVLAQSGSSAAGKPTPKPAAAQAAKPIAKPATVFSHGATSRSALVTAFVGAMERNDTTALMRLVVDRAEFGYLVYPTSPNAAPPYRQSPGLVWLSRSASTDKAVTRLLAGFGGKPLPYAGFTCADSVDHQGRNAIWSDCVVKRVVGGGDTTRLRMFGAIVARDGRFKFLSLTNGL